MLRPKAIEEIPEETIRIAKAAFPKGSAIMRLRDEFGSLYDDEDFAQLFPHLGQPALSPWRLAMVSVFQFLENLTDRQAANAVRGRLDWKYALSLEVEHPGFHYSVLSEFRSRLVAGDAEQLLLEQMLTHFKARGLLKARGKQRTDSSHVLAHIRQLNRAELVGESLRAALNELASVVPDWLAELVEPAWYERYSQRVEDYRLPSSKAGRADYLRTVGEDGFSLLDAVDKGRDDLKRLPKVQILREVFEHHYERKATRVRWRDSSELKPAAEAIRSPYEPEARYSQKRSTSWLGYKVHLTETCDEKSPNLIINVHTTVATEQDVSCTDDIHESLAERELLPQDHLVDTGYIDAELLSDSTEQYQVRLLGPPRLKPNWQSKVEGGINLYDFHIDWDQQRVICPGDKVSRRWRPHRTTGKYAQDMIQVSFANKECQSCALKPRCTRSSKQGRILNFQPRAQFEALKSARATMATEAGRRAYQLRAGIEGTLSQAVRAFGARRSRYRGLAKTHFQQVGTAVAINLVRVDAYLQGRPKGVTRLSRFARLKQAA